MAFKNGDKVILYRNNEERTGIPNNKIGQTFTIVGREGEWLEARTEDNFLWYLHSSYLKYAR